MTAAEIRAFNAGVAAVLALAQASADAVTAKLVEKPTRFNFAVGALASLADEGRALLISPAPAAPSTVHRGGAARD